MTASTHPDSIPARLVILLNGSAAPDSALIPLRYAATAAAMDVAVEMHAINGSVALLRRGAAGPELLARIRQAVELGVEIFVCPLALVEQGIAIDDVIDEVAGVRGAASLLVAGLEPGARFMAF